MVNADPGVAAESRWALDACEERFFVVGARTWAVSLGETTFAFASHTKEE